MEFRHIRSFLSVVETLHFGRSARFLNVGQPRALSLQVKALEDSFGATRRRLWRGSNLQSGRLSGRRSANSAIFALVLYRRPLLKPFLT